MIGKKLSFVVHKHHATNLHYDFRLEIGGKMPSWAIAKGPTLDPKMKRLAIETTDHEVEYKDFEGVIPEGQYGAGPVMVWDEGTYTPEIEVSKGVRQEVLGQKGEEVMKKGMEKGEIKFILHGKKLSGSFALVKTPHFGPKGSWLLIKHADEASKTGYDASTYDFSAKSGKSLAQIKDILT